MTTPPSGPIVKKYCSGCGANAGELCECEQTSGPPPREFWLRQYSQDGGMYSDIRVMKPSDCDLGVSPPPGHDNLKYYEEVHVIEKSAFDSVVAERDALLADNETGAKLFFDYWQSTLKERDALKFELQSKQRPLSEQVLALTIEKEALKVEVERLKAQDLTHAVLAADVKLREERDSLAAKLKVAVETLEEIKLWDATCPEETRLRQIVNKALAEIGDRK